jgi:hypothetical protein
LVTGLKIDDLMRLFVDAVEADLGADGDQRGAVGKGIRRAQQEVDRARPKRGRADARLARDAAIHIGHEGGGPLVAYRDEADV